MVECFGTVAENSAKSRKKGDTFVVLRSLTITTRIVDAYDRHEPVPPSLPRTSPPS